MLFLKKILTVSAMLLLLACGRKTGEIRQIPIENFFRNPERTSLQISPDGNYIAYLQSYENKLNLFVEELSSRKVKRLTSETGRGLTRFFWANNEQLLYLFDRHGDEFHHLYSVTKDGSKTIDLTPFEKVKMKFIDNMENQEDEILIAFNHRNPELFDLYRLNTVNGQLKMVAQNPGNISYWKADHSGKIRLAVETDGVNESILYRESEDKPFRRVITLNFKETLMPITFTADNKNIYAASNIGRDKMAIVEFDLMNARETRVIFSHPDVDVSDMGYSAVAKQPVYCSYVTDRFQMTFLTDHAREVEQKIRKRLDDQSFYIISISKDENRFVLRTYSDKTLGTFYLYDVKHDELIMISEASPWIDEQEMADMKPVTFKSRDGIIIHGYLTLPKGREAQNLPLVVNPHGGPWLRNKWGFNPETQFLANRGYAVLQVNYRGSEGYGKEFWQAGFKEIGRKMQDDITDGVQWLISEGIADSARVGVFGFSFGGYFALNGCIRNPEMYTCAVSYCGITNLFAYLKDIPPYYKPYLQMTYEMVGNPETDAEYFREFSPAFHTDKIRVPLLIAQGARDPRVSVEEINQFVKTVKKQGGKVNYILKQNEGHGFQDEGNKIEFYTEVEAFLQENLMSK